MKSPMKWKRKKNAAKKKGDRISETQRKITMSTQKVNGRDVVQAYSSDNISCDATDFLSHGSTTIETGAHSRQSELSRRQRRRAAVDAPGWVHNSTVQMNQQQQLHHEIDSYFPESTTDAILAPVISTNKVTWPPESECESVDKVTLETMSVTSRSLASQGQSTITSSRSMMRAPLQNTNTHMNPAQEQHPLEIDSYFPESTTDAIFAPVVSTNKVAWPPDSECKSVDPRSYTSRGQQQSCAGKVTLETMSVTSRSLASQGQSTITSSRSIRRAAPKILRNHGAGPVWPPDAASIGSGSVASRGSSCQEKSQSDRSNASTSSAYQQRADVSRAGSSRRSDQSRIAVPKQPLWREPVIRKTESESTTDAEFSEAFSKCSSSSNSMPPVDFPLPRKEIRDAIKYHHKLGQTLSKLVLDPELNNGKVVHSVASSTASTTSSTLSSTHLGGLDYVNSSQQCALGISITGPSKNWVPNFNPFAGIDNVSSMDSGTSSMAYSSTSVRTQKLEQHLSFLESHMIQKMASSEKSPMKNNEQCQDRIGSIVTSHPSFFSIMDDLRSPPVSTRNSSVSPGGFAGYIQTKVNTSGPSAANRRSFSPMGIASPPSTPMATVDRCSDVGDSIERVSFSPETDWKDDDTVNQEDLDTVLNSGELLVEDMRRVKDETATMMAEMNDKIRCDMKNTMEKEMGQHRLALKVSVLKMSKRLENVIETKFGKENKHPQLTPSRLDSTRLSPQASSENKMPPSTPAQTNNMDSEALLKTLEKSFRSMEASIMDKIATQIDKDALQQRQAIEEIIEERVAKVVEGASLEIKLAAREMTRESERLAKTELRENRTPPRDRSRTPPRRTPPREKTPPRSASVKKLGFATSGKSNDYSWLEMDKEEKSTSLEDTFAETMRAIDEFVDDCDDLADDFDKIAFRMQDTDIASDADCDFEDHDYEYIGQAN